MCDYSLEMYQSRPARAQERYQTHRFPSGSVGFTTPGDNQTAICMACDATLHLSKLPAHLRPTLIDSGEATVTFVRMEPGPYRDGVRFENGKDVSLQQLGPGVDAYLIDTIEPMRSVTPREVETV